MKYRVIKKQHNTDMCFVCGMENSAGTKAMFYDCENPDGNRVLLTIINPQNHHQSYPERMHGGIVSALLDESMGRAVQCEKPDIWAVTVDLSVRFRKSTPLSETLYIESHVTSLDTRTYTSEGKLFLADGTICATATSRFFIVPFDKAFAGHQLNDKNWLMVPDNVGEFIEILSQ